MMRTRHKYSLRALFCAGLSVALCFPISNSVRAATFPTPTPTPSVTPAETPCDPTYFDSMEQRAWLEAQREISQNQNLIYKPDSVLDYTCFGNYMNELADHATDMFSESTRWGPDVLGPSSEQVNHMNNALESLVIASLNVYLNSNFTTAANRNLLGGRSSIEGETYPANITNGDYSCDIMQQVWQQAKCMNFQQATSPSGEATFEGFFTFQDYANDSVDRPFPVDPCSEPAGLYSTAITAAGLDPVTRPAWALDETLTYLDRMDAEECGEFPPIATGIIVTRNQDTPQRYFEGVCLQPGCHYQPAGGVSGTPTAGGPARCVP